MVSREAQLKNSFDPYWTKQDPDRLVVVTDQGERVVALVYELWDLPLLCHGPVILSVRSSNNEELWRTQATLNIFAKAPKPQFGAKRTTPDS